MTFLKTDADAAITFQYEGLYVRDTVTAIRSDGAQDFGLSYAFPTHSEPAESTIFRKQGRLRTHYSCEGGRTD